MGVRAAILLFQGIIMTVQSLGNHVLTAPSSASQKQPADTYAVQRGDTLASIAASHRLPVGALHAANPQVLNPDVLYPEQVLNLPAKGDDAPMARSATAHLEPMVSIQASRPTLRQGDRGAAVRELQNELRKDGFNPGPVDGIFGAKTTAAVRAFQAKKGLVVDGIVGPKTWAALLNNPPPKPKGQAVVDAARQIANQHYRYVWGGGHHAKPGASTGIDNPNTVARDSTTKGYDCSGFVRMAVFQATGKDSMNGTAATQSSRCTRISRSELQPGDLIFWKTGSRVTHVAIYAGKNSQGVPMMYESAPSYEKRGSSYGTHLSPVSYQGTPSHYGRIKL